MKDNSIDTSFTRRQWLSHAAALAAAPSVIAAASAPLRVRAFDPAGTSCDKRYLETLLLTDQTALPYQVVAKGSDSGTTTIDVPSGNFELSMLLPVKDFGTVYLYADNSGDLYSPAGGEFLLNYECARSRAAFVRRYVKGAQAAGVTFSSVLMRRLERGEGPG
jgi:hypothetical protein